MAWMELEKNENRISYYRQLDWLKIIQKSCLFRNGKWRFRIFPNFKINNWWYIECFFSKFLFIKWVWYFWFEKNLNKLNRLTFFKLWKLLGGNFLSRNFRISIRQTSHLQNFRKLWSLDNQNFALHSFNGDFLIQRT
jgi:hypothetical protein